MNAEHASFADWDAAYVLGALSPADRRAFEAHLEECDLCRTAIADLAPTIGLLSRVAPERAESMLALAPVAVAVREEGPDAASRARVIEAGSHRARRRRGWWIGGLAAAAAVIVAAIVGVSTLFVPPSATQTIALEPLVEVPVTASVELTDVAWGTRIDMVCSYGGEGSRSWPYALVVTGVDGTTSEVSSWQALPGATARLSAGTALDPDEIAALEIRSVDSGKVLMRAEVSGAD